MSGRIPQHFIDEVVARSDIVELIERRVPLRKAGREYKACCPFHEEKTPSFTVSPGKQFYHCFGCGAHGTALGFLMEHDHMGFVEAVEELAARAGMEVPHEAGEDSPGLDLYRVMEQAGARYQRALKENSGAIEYLRGRGLDSKTVAEFGIGFAPDSWDYLARKLGGNREADARLAEAGLVIPRDENDPGRGYYDRFRNRVMFPIRDGRGRVIAFGGRIIASSGQRDAKYMNSPETPLFHKGRELYGLYEARKSLRDIPRLLVVEGYMDVVALAQKGLYNAVATLGTATTVEHLRHLFRVTEEVVFCFDGDRAGRQAAWRALENALPGVEGGRQMRFLFLPDGEDPDSLVQSEGAEAFSARIENAVPLSEFLIGQLAARSDMATVDGRAKMLAQAMPLLRRIPPGVYRTLLIDQLAETVKSTPERLAPLLDQPVERNLPAPVRKPAPRTLSAGRGNLVRQAITLILHFPGSAREIQPPEALRELDRPGLPLLFELLEIAQEHPHIRTAGLLERWRDRDEGRHLARLAATESLVEESAAAAELEGILRKLMDEARESRVTALLEKAAVGSLSPVEIEELRALQAEPPQG